MDNGDVNAVKVVELLLVYYLTNPTSTMNLGTQRYSIWAPRKWISGYCFGVLVQVEARGVLLMDTNLQELRVYPRGAYFP